MPNANQRATTRRALLRGAVAGVAGMVLPRFARVGFAAGGLSATPVAPDLTLLEGAGGNVLVLATEVGKVLVDSGAAAFTQDLRATLEELAGGAVVAVFNTHWHLDQVGGNEAFGRAGATIVAHEKTRIRLRTGYYLPAEDRYEKPLPEVAWPAQSFHGTHTTDIGGREIQCGYLIEAHTDGDIYVAFPDRNVIAVGDVVSPVRDPVFDWFGGGWLGGRVDSLALLLARSDAATRFVPSYGPVVGRAEVQAEHDMLLELFNRMVERVRLGEAADDMLAAGILEGLGRTFADPAALVYALHKGFWAHHNKLTHDIV
jgi:glyoxylase-like metal-dependent hydrolase (beta-lactamase superfamily II)